MADDESAALGGIRDILARFTERLDTREQVVRLDERVNQKASREEMNAADTRTLESASVMLDRAGAANQQYTRDQISSSALVTKNAIQEVDKHLGEKIDTRLTSIESSIAGLKAAIAAIPPPSEPRTGMHMPSTVGGTALGSVLVTSGYVFLYVFNLLPGG
jgi:hypothetical protein